MTVILIIPRVPPSLNELRGKKLKNFHNYKRLRDGWQSDIYHIAGVKNTRLLRAHKDLQHRAKVIITVERKKLLDLDNLMGGCKPVLDSLTRLEFICDDSPAWIDLDVRQEKSPNMQTVIHIGYLT